MGGASDTAREKNWRLRDEAELWAAEIAAVRRATGDVADAMTGVVEGREEALSLAQGRNFTITEDGTVVDNLLPLCLDVSPAEQAEIEAERARIAKELEFRVAELLRQAADIDHDYCLVLDRVLSGHIIDAENNAETRPSPRQVRPVPSSACCPYSNHRLRTPPRHRTRHTGRV